MKFAIEELLVLATRLDNAAAQCKAKAFKLRAAVLQMDEADAEDARAKDARHYAEVCRYFHKREAEREKATGNPPLWSDVIEFVTSEPELSAWPEADVRSWFNHFESNGWLVSGKAKMKNWKAAARNGFSNWRTKHPKKEGLLTSSSPDSDPKGWREFLKAKGCPYKPHAFGVPHLKDEYLCMSL